MPVDSEFLPRVVIETRNGIGSLKVNFKLIGADDKSISENARLVLEAFEDWTAYSIASIEHMPRLSGFGFYMADHEIKSEVVEFLKVNAIAHEEITSADTDEKDDYERHSFIIHDDDIEAVAQKLSTTSHMLKAASSIYRANLGALIAEFDFLMLRLLTNICKDFPSVLVADSETITAGTLRAGKTFDVWEQEQLEKKISSKLRESHSDIVQWILTDIAEVKDISSVTKSPFYRDFIEVCQRRHLFIHNGGIVNEDYRSKCIAAGINPDKIAKVGTHLSIDPNYLRSAAARVYLVGAFVLHLAFQNRYKENKKFSFRALLSASHDFLLSDLTKMAERVIDFAEFRSKEFDTETRLKFGINRALTKLFDPKLSVEDQNEQASKVLRKYDWSVVDPILKLALACTKRDFSDIINLAIAANKAGLRYQDAKCFCVFREARDIKGFMDCFPKAALQIEDHSQKKAID